MVTDEWMDHNFNCGHSILENFVPNTRAEGRKRIERMIQKSRKWKTPETGMSSATPVRGVNGLDIPIKGWPEQAIRDPLFCVVLVIAIVVSTSMAGAFEFVGSDSCKDCHREIYDRYQQSGHPFKLQRIDGKPPSYPPGTSPGVPRPPSGMSWKDISYVIGGYGWKARFMDREGYVLTGTKRQYNLANSDHNMAANWTAYDSRTAPRKPYTCGACHTTGWTKTGEKGPHQDSLAGIHGTWSEPGVTCEACHGPGSGHVKEPTKVKPSVEANCGQCHARGDVTQIDARNGLISHHEQYEDLLASPHRTVGCMACHDPHKTTKYARGGFKGQDVCEGCHEQVETRITAAPHSKCITCHMPFAAVSAVSKLINYKGGSVAKGDIRSHIFRIATDAKWKMFTDDGQFVRIDQKKRAYLTVDFACLTCHVTRDKEWALSTVAKIHGKTR